MADYLVDIDRDTGEFISGWTRIKKSIKTILGTRLRMRLMRLWWGSDFLELQDKPANQDVMMVSILAAAEAINRYEPEFKVGQITINSVGPDGVIDIVVDGVDLIQFSKQRTQIIL